ncbi:MAG: 50S ribosomal protein L23, partial [Chloroflexi bacterium]|nr:50S ribosomal protein L23 [Chloroflexota bacterium]
MNPYKIIIRPIDTEKTRYQASELGQYTFEVDRRANKIQVRQAIEAIYDKNVVAVNVMNMPAKASKRRGRRRMVRRPQWKKAVVTVAEG